MEERNEEIKAKYDKIQELKDEVKSRKKEERGAKEGGNEDEQQ